MTGPTGRPVGPVIIPGTVPSQFSRPGSFSAVLSRRSESAEPVSRSPIGQRRDRREVIAEPIPLDLEVISDLEVEPE